MKQSDIKEMSNENLLINFHTIVVRAVHEVNSRRGISQKTDNAERWILDEMIKRFDLNGEEVINGIFY